ncbi:MAG: tRNA (guanosine(46)-N7)-methyltransferase TrmB [Alphaproteobacteria bacterium]
MEESEIKGGDKKISPIRFYGRRLGRVGSPTRQKLMDEVLSSFSINLETLKNQSLDDIGYLFEHSSPYQQFWLEIGCGGGEHMVALANNNPEHGFIAAEAFLPGIGKLIHQMVEKKITNVRVFPEDIRQLFPYLPTGSLTGVILLFPDPWPKTAHANRRFVCPSNLEAIHRLLKENGEFLTATDDENLARWTEKQLQTSPFFEIIDIKRQRPQHWHSTRYESKALKQGKQPWYFTCRKKNLVLI